MSVLVNALLFQLTWFACVIGSSKGLVWPGVMSFCIFAFWQLHKQRRHPSDLQLIGIAITCGLVIDSLWIHLGFLNYAQQWPSAQATPLWLIILWAAFALTINHSLVWLTKHPLLPALMGLISAPLSYLAGQRLGAITLHIEPLLFASCVGLAWSIALTVLYLVKPFKNTQIKK